MEVCDPLFTDFINTSIIPLTAIATAATMTLIGAGYMLGQFTSNPKISLWARTEITQIFISVASVAFIILTLNTFCAINMNEVGAIFGLAQSTVHPCGNALPAHVSIYDAARDYLRSSACFAHSAMGVVRYHLEAYTVLSNLNVFQCGISCWFGQTGDYIQPLGGYNLHMGALNVFFNSAMISYFSALNFLFILLFVYKGFVLLFLPLGIFFRSLPYLRTFGSLLITVALCFLVIYPLLLAIYSLMGDGIFAPAGIDPTQYGENVFADTSGFSGTLGADHVKNIYFGGGKENTVGAIGLASAALIGAVFLPTLALLATIASVRYISRILGEEIDLSRIVQMV